MKGTSTLLNKWDKRYLILAREVATWSKDPSSKIGAVAVSDNKQLLATGYNGFPRGIADLPDRYNNRELKYKYVVHAEQNVIYNATYNGVSLNGATLYVYGLPVCGSCALGIVQVGIKRIVMPKMDCPERWAESFKFSASLFDEAGIKYEFIEVNDG